MPSDLKGYVIAGAGFAIGVAIVSLAMSALGRGLKV